MTAVAHRRAFNTGICQYAEAGSRTVTLARNTPLRATKSLERKTPLRSSCVLKRATPMRQKAPSKRVAKAKASKLPPAPKRTRRRGPERSEAFLEFVRRKPCFRCGRRPRSHPHHFGKRGKGQKCSDFLTVPLCEGDHRYWHDKGTLPDAPRADWLAWFRENAIEMRKEFDELAAGEEEFVVLEECAE